VNKPLHRAARRRIALLGCLAILFQAILFGWHHHELALPSHSARLAAYVEASAPLAPATAEDECDICRALHNLRTASGDVAAMPLPAGAASAPALPELVLRVRGSQRAFQARAPPRV
jgi:hypothetical protein